MIKGHPTVLLFLSPPFFLTLGIKYAAVKLRYLRYKYEILKAASFKIPPVDINIEWRE
jgi:hypothetical protein